MLSADTLARANATLSKLIYVCRQSLLPLSSDDHCSSITRVKRGRVPATSGPRGFNIPSRTAGRRERTFNCQLSIINHLIRCRVTGYRVLSSACLPGHDFDSDFNSAAIHARLLGNNSGELHVRRLSFSRQMIEWNGEGGGG